VTNPFAVGQRWISDTESDLGLGTVLEVDMRQITIVFMATGDTRRYAAETAPLTRVAFQKGDKAISHEGWTLLIDDVIEAEGTFVYIGIRGDTNEPATLAEIDLDNFIQFRSPEDRLFAGLIEGNRWFGLRRSVFEHRHHLAHSPIRGLLGARISVLPHQIYIAVEATRREHPRLLLADEVGLGKTIEAGLIMHRLWVTQRVKRVLIVVPPALLHQWLVEMLRKFNLRFSILDGERFAETIDSAPQGNPFLEEQLVLCTLDTLLEDDAIGDAACAAGWDLLIADEAHHLDWSPEQPSPEYQVIQALAEITPSVLLLTATPEQLGQAGHFARLRLLDPHRFENLESFLTEQASYTELAERVNQLLASNALSAADITALESRLGEAFSATEKQLLTTEGALEVSDLSERIVNDLIDRHGTGRLLFRNTRQAITGFPERRLISYDLTDDTPSTRASWLIELLDSMMPEQLIVITQRRETVEILAEDLRLAGIHSAQFHEGMSIVERDRAAAFFADPEEFCRVLICSEIGSEGRNFQFLHHMVLFELPEIPDVLEQRIGRLDRIGQAHDITIHVPASPGSRDANLRAWYHEGLDAFEHICRTGHRLQSELGDERNNLLAAESGDWPTLINKTKQRRLELEAEFEQGRDRLLELNSNRPAEIQEHLDALVRDARDYTVQDFMEAVFDRFGVNVEEQRDHWILSPSDHMQVEHFPMLSASGASVTFDRETALSREEFLFLSWDHPMVTAAMDLILDEGYGQADCQVISMLELTPGLALVEAVYQLQCTAPPHLDMERYLPFSVASYYVGLDGRNYTDVMRPLNIDGARKRYDRAQLKGVVQQHRATLEKLIAASRGLAETSVPDDLAEARAAIDEQWQEERNRLVALQRVNTSVSDAEIAAKDALHNERLEALDNTHPRLIGLRVLFNQ